MSASVPKPLLRRPLALLSLAVGMLLLFGLVVYRFFPATALAAIYHVYEMRAGLREARAVVDGYEIPYYFGGPDTRATGQDQRPTIVLIHGFGDSKISFVQSAEFLTPDYFVILPAVPGFGETAQDPARRYDVGSQAARLHELLDQVRPGRVVLVGNSMGGHIAAAYTLRYQKRVAKLILLDPAGLRVDDPVPYKPEAAPLRSDADFERRLELSFVKKPWVPTPFRIHFVRESQRNFAWLNRVRADIRGGSDYILNQRLRELDVPTLIVWGAGDQVIRVAHAPVWQAGIAGSQLLVLPEMGHGPQYENPELTARLIREFIETGRASL